jgi:hypothetical protein
MSISSPAPAATSSSRAFWWIAVPTLLLAVPALWYGLEVIADSLHSDADLAGLGVLIGLVLGAPAAVATVLVLIGVALRRRSAGAALGLAIAGLVVLGLLTLLVVPFVVG